MCTSSLFPFLLFQTSTFSVSQLEASSSLLLPSTRRSGREESSPDHSRDAKGDDAAEQNFYYEEEGEDLNALKIKLTEQVERFLTTKLFPVFLTFMVAEDRHDIQLKQKLEWLEQWIKPSHLELDEKVDFLLFGNEGRAAKKKHMGGAEGESVYLDGRIVYICQPTRREVVYCHPKYKMAVSLIRTV